VEQEAGGRSRRQEAGGRRQEAGAVSRRQEAGDRRQEQSAGGRNHLSIVIGHFSFIISKKRLSSPIIIENCPMIIDQ
jgi:hypothetical protein